MFTGIIEQTGSIQSVDKQGNNRVFWVSSPLSGQLRVDQSISHNGVCLTVEEVSGENYRVTAISETLDKTNLSNWQPGHIVNLERCIKTGDRLDGHFVQGHVDTTAKCTGISEKNGSWEFSFEFEPRFASLIIEKGSIALNGISLTIFNIHQTGFTVAIIPYTYHHTNMHQLRKGDQVNIEFDMIGKYINRMKDIRE